MTDREYLEELAGCLRDKAGGHALHAADLLSRGDASALHWTGVAQGYRNIAAMIERYCASAISEGIDI